MATVGLVAAVVTSLVVCAITLVVGRRLGLVDRPDDELKPHSRPVVALGGLGVLTGVHVGLAVAGAFDVALLAATLVVWAMGLVDDLFGLSPAIRIAGATVAGVLLVLLSGLSDDPVLAVMWVAATVVVINAVNLLDGLDGLASSVAMVSLAGLWWFGVTQGTVGPHFYVVSIGAILGFVYWNLPPARMFLGDNGAYVIGVTLTWAALEASPDGTAGLVGIAIIGVPILDMCVTILRRLISRTVLVSGDRDHTYDLLVRSGIGVGTVDGVYALGQAVWATSAVVVSILLGDRAAVVITATAGLVLVLLVAFRMRPRQAA